MLPAKLYTVMAGLLAGAILILGPDSVASPAAVQTDTTVPSQKKQEVRIKWEYKALPAPQIEKLAPKKSKDKLMDGLNTLGEQGWELVAVTGSFPEMGGFGGIGKPFGSPPPGIGRGPGGPGMSPGPPITTPTIYLFKRPK